MTIKRRYIPVLFMIGVILAAGCTQRDNPIGIEKDETPFSRTIRNETLFDYYYSYEDTVSAYYPNDKLIVGNYRDNHSIALLRFGNLPDPGFVLPDKAEFSIGVMASYEAENISLKLGTIQQDWEQQDATWKKATAEKEWSYDWDNLGNIDKWEDISGEFNEKDSLFTFTIPREKMTSIINEWIEDEPESFGLALFTEDIENSKGMDSCFRRNEGKGAGMRGKGYLEMFNRLDDKGPVLSFEYLESEDDEEEDKVTYDRPAMHSTFINSVRPGDDFFKEKTISTGNLPPTRSVIKLNVPLVESVLNPNDDSDLDVKQIIINKAELILFCNQEKTHFSPSEHSIGLLPYILTEEYEDKEKLPVEPDHYRIIEPFYRATVTPVSDSVAVNITSLLQAFVAGLHENKGMVLRTAVENKDNTCLHFYGMDAPDENKRPYLKIIYTKPVIK